MMLLPFDAAYLLEGTVKKQYCRCIVWFLALWLSPWCCSQVVSIRVVNANDGHPLARQNVSVALLYEKGEKTPAKYDPNLSLEADGNGEVQFRLPEPARQRRIATSHNQASDSDHFSLTCDPGGLHPQGLPSHHWQPKP
jgi:hypothetical protein